MLTVSNCQGGRRGPPSQRELNVTVPDRDWRGLHEDAVVWILHDHFHHRLDANLRMRQGGVTAKTAVPIGDLAVYNDSDGEDHARFFRRTLAQTEGWADLSLARLARARRLFQSRPDRFFLALEADDVIRAKREGTSAVFLGMEGCKAFEGRLGLVRAFHDAGVRQMQLTWVEPNQLVDADPQSGRWRLSGFGKEAVDAMVELGVVIDLSHAPWSLFEEVMERVARPVVVSHGAPSEVHPGSGDMSRRHLDALKSCGGVLGLHFCRHYIRGPFATFEDFLDTLDYLIEHGYEDTVALGGDLFEDDAYFRSRHGPPPGATHENWRVFIDELSDIGRIPNVTRGMSARGHSAEVIRKVLGGNALRVYRAALGS